MFCTLDSRGHHLPSPGPDLILGARRCLSTRASAPGSPGSPTFAPRGWLGCRVQGASALERLGPFPLPPGRAGGGEQRPGEPGVTGAVAAAAPGRAARRLLGGVPRLVLSRPMRAAVVRRLATGGANGRRQRGAGWDGRPPREAARGGPGAREATRSCGRAGGRAGERAACRRGCGPAGCGREARAAPGAVTVSGGIVTRSQPGRPPGWPRAQTPGPALGGLGAAVAAVRERCCPPPAAGGAR